MDLPGPHTNLGWKSARSRFVQFRKERVPVGILYTTPILELVFAAIIYESQKFYLWGKLAREPARQPVMEQASSKASSQPGAGNNMNSTGWTFSWRRLKFGLASRSRPKNLVMAAQGEAPIVAMRLASFFGKCGNKTISP